MSGPAQQTTSTIVIPPGEGRRTYSPVALAWFVENLERTIDDDLKSVNGPAILRIKRQAFTSDTAGFGAADVTSSTTVASGITDFGWKTERPHSIFFARLMNGSANTLLYRFGSRIYRFTGNQSDADEVILTGLSSTDNPSYPDQYVVINDRIIWTNGVDRAQTISYDGSATELGFAKPASTPMVMGPTQPDFDEIPQYYPNAMGYSWPGRIGTPGDLFRGREGSLLKGQWYYYFQYEDVFGNVSEFSPASEPASIGSNQADPYVSTSVRVETAKGKQINLGPFKRGSLVGEYNTDNKLTKYLFSDTEVAQGVEIDDLTRRFLLKASGDAPEHTVATRIYRTADTLHKDPTPRFLTRVPGSGQFVYDDNASDSDLGTEWDEIESVPVFRVACAHQGRLIVGNVPGDPGIVRRSEPGFAGTFLKDDYIYPDTQGAEITALASHNGSLLAFTESAVYVIGDDFLTPQPLTRGIGCVAPRSIQARPDGTLVWLSQEGFYGMRALGDIVRISSPIDKVLKNDVNFSRIHLAVATINTETGEYRCVLAAAGEAENKLMFCYDGKYWRRQTLGIHIADMCSMTDWRRYTYAIGSDPRERETATVSGAAAFSGEKGLDLSRVFVLDRQTTDWFGPPRRIRYRSAWIVAAENGLVPTNVRTLYLGMLDAWNGKATIRLFKNGSWKPIQEMDDVLLVGPDDDSGMVADTAGNARVGPSRVHNPRLFWRQVPVDIHNANSWAFEIELVGSPAPKVPSSKEEKGRDLVIWEELYRDKAKGLTEFRAAAKSHLKYELGRIRIAAFAFDTSIATKGAPLGRVPRRQDK